MNLSRSNRPNEPVQQAAPARKPRSIGEQIDAIRTKVEEEGILNWERFETEVLHIGHGRDREDYKPADVWQAYVAFKEETQLDVEGQPVVTVESAVAGANDEAVPQCRDCKVSLTAENTSQHLSADECDACHETNGQPQADDAPPVVCSACAGPLHPMDADGICKFCRRTSDPALL